MEQYFLNTPTGLAVSDFGVLIGDIDKRTVDNTLMSLIEKNCIIAYKDKILDEHLYNVEDFVMKIEEIAESMPQYAASINEIIAFTKDRDLSYIRFVTQ